jgi:hypothetical protein
MASISSAVLGKTFADHVVDGGLHESGRDRLAVLVTIGVVQDEGQDRYPKSPERLRCSG